MNRPLLNSTGTWEIPPNLDTTNFDFNWRPYQYEPPFIHEFGTQHQKTGGPRYVVSGATGVKYQDSQRAIALGDSSNWEILYSGSLDIRVDFDWSWHPESTEPPYLHKFQAITADNHHSVSLIYKLTESEMVKDHDELVGVLDVKLKPLDIVFVSNGETGAEDRYQQLCRIADRTVKRVSGVDGRENALRQAAEKSETDWFFCFPGKLYTDDQFDFTWIPRLLDEPKHYIFYAKNPLNGLEYGHQAAVCYNRQLVLETTDYGLDFTMSKPHCVVPIISGVAQYNLDPVMTWRTAFREVIKLMADQTQENKDRLNTWLTVANGDNREWSLLGAEAGVDYYQEVAGDHHELMNSFRWEWLDDHYKTLYQNI
jgi:hypothetical protein